MKRYYLKNHQGIYRYSKDNQTKYGFRLRYYDDEHKRREKSRRGYNSLAGATKAQSDMASLIENDPHSLTVTSWCKRYMAMIKPPIRKISTYKSYQHLLTENVFPTIGYYRINHLRLDIYQTRCINALLQKGLSRRTVITTNQRLQTVFNYAVKDGYLKTNPIRFATVPKVNVRPSKEIMNGVQLSRFLSVLKCHSLLLQVVYQTLLHTGMRCGELLGLHWRDLDLHRRLVRIRYTRDEYGLRTPKTAHSKRTFAISDELNSLLRRYYHYERLHFNIDDNSLVILGEHGKPLMYSLVSVWLKKLLIESDNKDLVGRFTPHSFRHLFASHLISHGIDPITVSHILGHANPDITMKIYAQSAPDDVPDINKIDKKL